MYYLFGISKQEIETAKEGLGGGFYQVKYEKIESEELVAIFDTEEKANEWVDAHRDKIFNSSFRGQLMKYSRVVIRKVLTNPPLPNFEKKEEEEY